MKGTKKPNLCLPDSWAPSLSLEVKKESIDHPNNCRKKGKWFTRTRELNNFQCLQRSPFFCIMCRHLCLPAPHFSSWLPSFSVGSFWRSSWAYFSHHFNCNLFCFFKALWLTSNASFPEVKEVYFPITKNCLEWLLWGQTTVNYTVNIWLQLQGLLWEPGTVS